MSICTHCKTSCVFVYTYIYIYICISYDDWVSEAIFTTIDKCRSAPQTKALSVINSLKNLFFLSSNSIRLGAGKSFWKTRMRDGKSRSLMTLWQSGQVVDKLVGERVSTPPLSTTTYVNCFKEKADVMGIQENLCTEMGIYVTHLGWELHLEEYCWDVWHDPCQVNGVEGDADGETSLLLSSIPTMCCGGSSLSEGAAESCTPRELYEQCFQNW